MDQLARWQEFLRDFDFDCQFRPGHKHGNADALSWLPQSDDLITDTTTASINAITTSEPTRHIWSINQSSDPDTAIIYRHLTEGLPKPTERDMKGTCLRE
uniref:Retrovirus-related Pol polyprotein from transposon 17.6 n=1 Tax=Schistocephalus solidus TaxID=70667 RepID=A0A0X3P4P7_SCHSO